MEATFPEFLVFAKQLGLALAGAAALWGFVFTRWSKHRPGEDDCLVYEWIGMRLLAVLAGGVALVFVAWALFPSALSVLAHEGVALVPGEMETAQGFERVTPVLVLWALSFFFGVAAGKFWPKAFSIHLEWFYAVQLAFVVTLMMMFAWQGGFDKEQFFFWGHTLHSIMTVGTVLVLDILFLLAQSSTILKQHVYPLFPTISKVIWVGLGLDFLSSALVFEEALSLTPKFFFMQTVVGIVIINGALLAGPIAKRMIETMKSGAELSFSWTKVGSVAGAVSATSWLTVTFVDSFENLALSYLQFLGLYGVALVALLFVHELWERFQPKSAAR